jgi:hypothetical protein
MITNIDIDEDLVQRAMQVSGARSKREVVDRALREMVARAGRPRVREVWGTAEPDAYWPGYDPKTDPGEPAGKYRVEQGIASYKVAPAPADESEPSTGETRPKPALGPTPGPTPVPASPPAGARVLAATSSAKPRRKK